MFIHTGVVAVWIFLSLAALAAMYHLWWNRELVLYGGKCAEKQREEVVADAGLPATSLLAAKSMDQGWPDGVAYRATGSEVTLSYLKYLVLPRVPSDSDTYQITCLGDDFLLKGELARPGLQGRPFNTVPATPRGLLLSALIIFGIAAGLYRYGLSIPEGVAVASLVLCVLAALVKLFFSMFLPTGLIMIIGGAWGAWTFF